MLVGQKLIDLPLTGEFRPSVVLGALGNIDFPLDDHGDGRVPGDGASVSARRDPLPPAP